jgi:hypothetical protein
MVLTYPSVAGFIFTFLPAGSTPHQWERGSTIPLRTSSLVFNWFIISVSIDTYLMVTGFVFTFHCPLQALLLPNGWGDPLSLFRHPY